MKANKFSKGSTSKMKYFTQIILSGNKTVALNSKKISLRHYSTYKLDNIWKTNFGI